MNKSFFLIICASFFLFSACQKKTEGKAIARIGNAYLYESDLINDLPAGISGADSTKRAQVYVKNWLTEQAVLHKAAINLDIDEERYAKRMASYKNELIIYDFQNELIGQKLNKEISNDELMAYYEQAQDNFVQKDHVVRLSYAIFENGTPDLRQFGKWMRADDQLENVRNFARDNAISFDVEGDRWISIERLYEILPFNKNTINLVVDAKDYRYMKQNTKEYFVRVYDYRKEGDITPFELVKDKIESTLLNKKKTDLLKNLREDLYREYSVSGELEIFEQNK